MGFKKNNAEMLRHAEDLLKIFISLCLSCQSRARSQVQVCKVLYLCLVSGSVIFFTALFFCNSCLRTENRRSAQ